MATKKSVYLAWNILFEDNITQVIKDSGIKKLMSYVHEKSKVTAKSGLLQHELFKSEINNLSYILEVFITEEIKGIAAPANAGDSRVVGPPPPPPPPGIVSVTPTYKL